MHIRNPDRTKNLEYGKLVSAGKSDFQRKIQKNEPTDQLRDIHLGMYPGKSEIQVLQLLRFHVFLAGPIFSMTFLFP